MSGPLSKDGELDARNDRRLVQFPICSRAHRDPILNRPLRRRAALPAPSSHHRGTESRFASYTRRPARVRIHPRLPPLTRLAHFETELPVHDSPDGEAKQLDVRPWIQRSDIEIVVLQLLVRVQPIVTTHLRQSRDAGFDPETLVECGQFTADLPMPDNPFRARSHQTHVAHHDIDELWYLVKVEPAQHVSDHRRWRFFFRYGLRSAADVLSRAEFEYPERLSSTARPFLRVENRPAILQPDGDGDGGQEDQPEGKKQDDDDAYDHKVEGSLVSILNDGGLTGIAPAGLGYMASHDHSACSADISLPRAESDQPVARGSGKQAAWNPLPGNDAAGVTTPGDIPERPRDGILAAPEYTPKSSLPETIP